MVRITIARRLAASCAALVLILLTGLTLTLVGARESIHRIETAMEFSADAASAARAPEASLATRLRAGEVLISGDQGDVAQYHRYRTAMEEELLFGCDHLTDLESMASFETIDSTARRSTTRSPRSPS